MFHGIFYSSKNWQNVLVVQSGSSAFLDGNSWWLFQAFQWIVCASMLPLRKLSVVTICHSFVIKTFKSFFTIVVKALFSILMAFIWFLFPFKIRFNCKIYFIGLFKESAPYLSGFFFFPVYGFHSLFCLFICYPCFLAFYASYLKKNQFIYFPFVLLNSRSIYCNVLCVFLLSIKLPTPHKFLYLS